MAVTTPLPAGVPSACQTSTPVWLRPEQCAPADILARARADALRELQERAANRNEEERRILGTFTTRAAAEKHEREIQFFKRRR